MKKLTMVLLLSSLLIAVSCSSTSARFDYERGVDFSTFKTFGFFPIPQDMKTSELVLKRIGDAIAKDLTAKGLTYTKDNPDLLIAAHTGVKDKVQVSSYGYGYAPYYHRGYWGASQTTVHQYEEGTLIIDIVDNGPGSPDSERSKVFERFYRIDKTRSKEKGGAGLGLAIARWAVEINGGAVEFLDKEGKGARCRITLNKIQSA